MGQYQALPAPDFMTERPYAAWVVVHQPRNFQSVGTATTGYEFIQQLQAKLRGASAGLGDAAPNASNQWDLKTIQAIPLFVAAHVAQMSDEALRAWAVENGQEPAPTNDPAAQSFQAQSEHSSLSEIVNGLQRDADARSLSRALVSAAWWIAYLHGTPNSIHGVDIRTDAKLPVINQAPNLVSSPMGAKNWVLDKDSPPAVLGASMDQGNMFYEASGKSKPLPFLAAGGLLAGAWVWYSEWKRGRSRARGSGTASGSAVAE